MPSNTFESGKLKEYVTIEKPSTSQDSLGKPNGWVAFASNLPAEVQDQSGRETYLAAQRFVDQVSHVVKIRFLPGINGNMRVLWNGRILQIQAVLQPDGKRIEHRLICLESASNA
jgi:SPP1 family predicted phage head-tail adaptor